MRVTQLKLSDQARQLAAMRAAQLRCSLSYYVTRLIQSDADSAGLSSFLAVPESAAPSEEQPQ